jgi:site-specific recombinase XerD
MKTPRQDYLWQHPRSPLWWYRRDVPRDVRAHINKERWKLSLRTADKLTALREARRVAAAHDILIETARRDLGREDVSRLTDQERQRVADAGGIPGYVAWLEQRSRDAERAQTEATLLREAIADNLKEPLPADRDDVDPDWAMARTAGLEAEREVIDRQIADNAPMLQRLGITPPWLRAQRQWSLADKLVGALGESVSITLSGVVARWEAAKKPTAPEQFRYPAKLFEDLNGPLPVHAITPTHIRDFRDALSLLPRAGGKKFNGMTATMQSMIDAAERERLPRISAATAAKYFRTIKSILGFAVSDGYLSRNPVGDLRWQAPKRKASERRDGKRRSFSPAEYEKLIALAEATKADKPDDLWFLRLAIWSGARGEELAQLAPADVRRVGGVLVLDLHDRGDNHLKTDSALRRVPVHPHLLALGFADFVASASGPYLFASLEADSKGRRYGRMGSRLTRLIHSAGIRDSRVVPYSTRHSFKDSLRTAGVPEAIQESIMGHRDPGHSVSRGYGQAQVHVLAEWIAKVDPLDKTRVVTEYDDGDDEDLSRRT